MTRIVLIDGEHHPPAVRAAIDALADVVGAVFCGGTEKAGADDAYGVPVVRAETVGDALREAIDRFAPDAVLDMTDEPVLSNEDRFRLASIALSHGVAYTGADFDLRPPSFADVLTKPSISIFATGKRTGKTAIASALARHAAAQGRRPLIVAVGRGGPDPPRLIEAGTKLTTDVLLDLVDAGQHASSDYVEDALTSGVTTIGAVRVGGGLAGATICSNMADGARMAEGRAEDLVILEGSGASIPEVRARTGIVVVPAHLGSSVASFLNPYRLLLADLAVVTMAEEGSAAAETQAAIHACVPGLEVLPVVFRPQPLGDVSGRKAFFCTTAPQSTEPVLREHLEQVHGCEVLGMTHHLSDRSSLRRDLAQADGYDVMLVELKAAAVDVVVREAYARNVPVVFVNNDVAGTGISAAFDRVIAHAEAR